MKELKRKLVLPLFDIFDKYVYSSGKINIFNRYKLKFGNYKIIRTYHNGLSWSGWYSLKIFFNKKLIFKIKKEMSNLNPFKIKKINLNKLSELYNCYNKFINITNTLFYKKSKNYLIRNLK